MKKMLCLILTVFLSTLLVGCEKNEQNEIFGDYEFDTIIYVSPLSSYSTDYIEKQMVGTKYEVKSNVFRISSLNDKYELTSPEYKEKIMGDDLLKIFKDINLPILEYDKKYRYEIYGSDNEKIKYYLYSLDDELWIASYVDNTATKKDIIMSIAKLKQ